MHPTAAANKMIGAIAVLDAKSDARLDAIEAKLDRLLSLLDRPAAAEPEAATPTTNRKAR